MLNNTGVLEPKNVTIILNNSDTLNFSTTSTNGSTVKLVNRIILGDVFVVSNNSTNLNLSNITASNSTGTSVWPLLETTNVTTVNATSGELQLGLLNWMNTTGLLNFTLIIKNNQSLNGISNVSFDVVNTIIVGGNGTGIQQYLLNNATLLNASNFNVLVNPGVNSTISV